MRRGRDERQHSVIFSFYRLTLDWPISDITSTTKDRWMNFESSIEQTIFIKVPIIQQSIRFGDLIARLKRQLGRNEWRPLKGSDKKILSQSAARQSVRSHMTCRPVAILNN